MGKLKINTIYKRLLYSFIGIALIINVIVIAVNSINYRTLVNNLIYDFNTSILSQISYSAEYLDSLAKQVCISSFSNSYTIPMMYSNKLDVFESINGMKNLKNSAEMTEYIDSIYIYNGTLNKYISTKNSYLKSPSEFGDRQVVDIIESKNLSKNILKPIPRKLLNSNVFTYIICSFNNSGKVSGAVIVNIKGEYLNKLLAALKLRYSSEYKGQQIKNDVYIINQKGVVISHSKSDIFLRETADKDVTDIILQKDSITGQLQKNRNIYTYYKAGLNNWIFMSVSSYDSIFGDYVKTSTISMGIALFILTIGFVFTILLTKKIYEPMQDLLTSIKNNNVKQLNTKKNNLNEIRIISKSFATLSLVEKKDFLSTFLEGDIFIEESEIKKRLTQYGFNMSSKNNYFLVIFIIDNYQKFKKINDSIYKSKVKDTINTVIREIFTNTGKCEVVDLGGENIVLLGQTDQSLIVNYNHIITIKAQEVINAISTQTNISLSVLVSQMVENIGDINDEFESTLELEKQKQLEGSKTILFLEDFKKIDNMKYIYPLDKEKIFRDALEQKNVDIATSMCNEIFSSVQSLSYKHLDLVVERLKYKIQEYLYSCKSIENSIFTDFSKNIEEAETFREISMLFKNLIIDIIEPKKADYSGNMLICNKVIEIIEKTYHDQNLCLNSISNEIGLAPSYVGRLFKKEIGLSVSDTIKETRLKKVAELILSTDMSINHILENVGIEKSSYFYTLFKQYFGISVAEFKRKA